MNDLYKAHLVYFGITHTALGHTPFQAAQVAFAKALDQVAQESYDNGITPSVCDINTFKDVSAIERYIEEMNDFDENSRNAHLTVFWLCNI